MFLSVWVSHFCPRAHRLYSTELFLRYLERGVRLQLISFEHCNLLRWLRFNASCCFRIFFTLIRKNKNKTKTKIQSHKQEFENSKEGRWKVDGHQENIAGSCQNSWHEWNKWMKENENGRGVSSGRQNETSANYYEWGNCCWANKKNKDLFFLQPPSKNN